MSGFWKKKPDAPPAAERGPKCHVILLSDCEEAVGKLMIEYLQAEDQVEHVALYIDPDNRGGMAVTLLDPKPLVTLYRSKGVKSCVVTMPALRGNPHIIVTDLQTTGEYDDLRREFLP